MPGLAANQVTLNEVLEVRGGPLNEDELWALLYQSCDVVKDFFLGGKSKYLQNVLRALCLDSIILCGSGRIKFVIELEDGTVSDKRFIAPERFITRAEDTNDFELEKMFIYSIGMVIYAAAEFGGPTVGELCLSSEMETLLLYMSEDDPTSRCTLAQVFQACNSRKGIYLSIERVKSLVKSILGNDIQMDDSSPSVDGLSTSSSVLKIFSPTHDYSNPYPLGTLRALSPLSSTRTNGMQRPEALAPTNGFASHDITDGAPRNHQHQPRTIEREFSAEAYEPLTNKIDRGNSDKPVLINSKTPVTEGSITRAHTNTTESALDKLPPLGRIASVPHDKAKSLSAYSTPNFKRLMTIEKKKLTNDGFYDEERGKIKVVDSRYKSMPSLVNTAESESPRSGKASVHSADYPYGHPKGNYRKLTRFASKDSMDSASMATSQFSSTLSLNYGSYALDSQNDRILQRPRSLYSGSSNDGTAFNSGFGSRHVINETARGGPEFIIFPHDSELAVIDITPARLGPIPSGRRKICVMLPTAQRLELLVQVSAIAKEVFDQVTEYLGLKETLYFGLTQIKESEHIFLDLESKLTKLAPSGWKDDKKNKIDFILHFKVKFFVENTNALRHSTTRHLFYLQLRREILCGYISCQEEVAISLASLALQAEFGDYVEQFHGRCYFEAEHYLPGKVLSKMTRSDIYHQLPLLHHSYRGLTEGEAEKNFLKEVQRLKEYGTLFYHVSRSKKNPADAILLGICVKGIVLYEIRGHTKTEIHRQLWHMIGKFSFRRKKFVVEPKKGIGLPTLTLYAANYKKAKYLLNTCQSFHRFSLLSQPRGLQSDSGSISQSLKSSQGEDKTDSIKENRPPNKATHSLDVASEAPVVDRQASRVDIAKEDRSSRKKQQSLTEGQRDIRRNAQNLPTDAADPNQLERRIGDSGGQGSRGDDALEESPQHKSSISQSWSIDEYSPMTRRRLSTLKGVTEKRISVVELKRDAGQSLGITIVGGEDSKRHGTGIFIKSILGGGIAAKDGTLQQGDRILSVNGKSLEQITHDKAAAILKNASGDVQLVVSQFSNAGTSFLDKTGLSPVNERDFNESPNLRLARKSIQKQGNVSDAGSVKGALMLSPILRDSPKNPQKSKVAATKNKMLVQEHIVAEEQIATEEIPFTENEMIVAAEAQNLNSTPAVEESHNEDANESVPEEMMIVVKKRNNSLGMKITGGLGSGLPKGAIYVQHIDPDGPVKEDGRLKIGDCILAVNGIDIGYIQHKQAVEVLRKAPEQTSLLVSRSRAIHPDILAEKPPLPKLKLGEKSPKRGNSLHDEFVVEIKKGPGGLGLSLSGGAGAPPDFKDLIMVRRLFPGQPASLSEKLRIGDVIVAVNGTKVVGYTQQEAINLLRKAKSVVKLLVKRPHPNDIPEELLVETPRESLDPKSVLDNIQRKINERAIRQMPETPLSSRTSDDEHPSSFSNTARLDDSDGGDIIPYSETLKIGEMETNIKQQLRPVVETSTKEDSRHLSSHEVLVHAQIGTSKQKPVQQEMIDEPQIEYQSEPQPQFESGIEPRFETQTESHFISAEHPVGASAGFSDLDLSLPELPSSDEAGLKLPEYSDELFTDEEQIQSQVEVESRQQLSSDSSVNRSTNPSASPGISAAKDVSKDYALSLGSAESSAFEEPNENIALDAHSIKSGSINSGSFELKKKPSEFMTSDSQSVKSNVSSRRSESSQGITKSKQANDFASVISDLATVTPDSVITAGDTKNVLPDCASSGVALRDPKFECFEISLTKGSRGLGFTLAGGKSTTGGCYICEIVADPAKACGKLQSGDQIVMVDSLDISQYEHMDAVDVLRGTSTIVRLGIRRMRSGKHGKKDYGYEMVTLNRNARGRLGLVLGEENGEIIVEDTVQGEPASEEGSLRHGDKIKEINEIPLEGMSLSDANAILDESMPIVQLAIERRQQAVRESRYAVGATEEPSQLKMVKSGSLDNDMSPSLGRKFLGERFLSFARSDSHRSDSSATSSPKKSSVTNSPILKKLDVMQDNGYRMKKSTSQDDKGEIILVQLEKGPKGLGMSLTGNNDYGDTSGAFIANINPDGVAQRTGKLKKGDKLISVNGQNIENKQQKEVVAVLRQINGPMALEVFRYPVNHPFKDRGSSLLSSEPSEDLDLEGMDLQLTDNHALDDQSALTDKLMALLPKRNLKQDADHPKDHSSNLAPQTNLDLNDVSKVENPKAPNSSNLILNSKSESIRSNKSQSSNSEPKPESEVFIATKRPSVSHELQDISWNDSDLSDEEHSRSNERETNLALADLKKSTLANLKLTEVEKSNVTAKEEVSPRKEDDSNNDVTVHEASVSFSSTFERVTPSSSIVSSSLDEITPVYSSDEDLDFDLSASLIPDLSSLKPSDKEAYDKLFNQGGSGSDGEVGKSEDQDLDRVDSKSEEESLLVKSQLSLKAETIADSQSMITSEGVAIPEGSGAKISNEEIPSIQGYESSLGNGDNEEPLIHNDDVSDLESSDNTLQLPTIEILETHSKSSNLYDEILATDNSARTNIVDTRMTDGKSMRNQISIDSGNSSQQHGSIDHMVDLSWKEVDSEESADEDHLFMEADSLDVAGALEEFEMSRRKEDDRGLKKGGDVENETSFTIGRVEADRTTVKNENATNRIPKLESRIPKLDPRKLSSSPPRKSPRQSHIPVFSPPRSPSKSNSAIELAEKKQHLESDSITHAETAFTSNDPASNEAAVDSDLLQVVLDSESDISSDSDDDVTLNLTGDTLSYGQDEIDVRIAHFQSILNSDQIDKQFQVVKALQATDSCDVARRSSNREKNRFRSILPYDKTRLCLAGGEERDYINASHVKVQIGENSFTYVASQGPLPNTVDDFWRMVWEQKVQTIVMLTKDVEGGKVKCHRYWPDTRGIALKAADRFRVDLTHEKETGNTTERSFSLLNTKLNKSVTVNHLLFNSWPETGVPKHLENGLKIHHQRHLNIKETYLEPLPFLMFVRYSLELHTNGPLLVHCSAGTGRTGLFIVTDVMNKMVTTGQEFDILEIVKSLKQQRQGLLQTRDQFIFCYKMAIEILQEEKHLTY